MIQDKSNNLKRGADKSNSSPQKKLSKNNTRSMSRGAAIRAHKRSIEDAQKMLDSYTSASQKSEIKPRANQITDDFNKLKITFLGGLEDVGEKNCAIIEYQNDAIVLDCGNNLGVDLPGINYEIVDPVYLESIKHKIRGYVITHGHLDHIGGLKHIVPKFPAPIYGSGYSIGIIEKSFQDVPAGTEIFTPQTVTMNMDNHEKLKEIGRAHV